MRNIRKSGKRYIETARHKPTGRRVRVVYGSGKKGYIVRFPDGTEKKALLDDLDNGKEEEAPTSGPWRIVNPKQERWWERDELDILFEKLD